MKLTKRIANAFSWFKSDDQTSTPTKRAPRRPAILDWTDGLTVNRTLTKGLYHNSYPGLKLAGGLSYAPIAIPVWFMGLPVPLVDNERAQETLDVLVRKMSQQMLHIHTQSHRDGTVWVWPHYSAKQARIVWEFINDDVVTDVIRDLETNEVAKIITDEEIELTVDYNLNTFVRRKRTFEPGRVTVEWIQKSGYRFPEQLRNRSFRNPAGVLPIPFANNRDGEEVRGHSDYERLVTDLKDYHDIEYKLSTMLAKFSVKMVQQIGSSSVDKWLANNGADDFDDIDVSTVDLIINQENEATTFVFPERAQEAYEAALKRKFKKIVEESSIPEIAWGVKTEGNHASAEEQMGVLVQYVQSKRDQATDPYEQLFRATVNLLATAGELPQGLDVVIKWNALDALSEKTKSEVFANFARGVAALVDSAGFTKEQLHNLWEQMYPEATTDDFEEFRVGLSDMAGHKQFKDEAYTNVIDFMAVETEQAPVDE